MSGVFVRFIGGKGFVSVSDYERAVEEAVTAERAAVVAWLRKRAQIGPWLPIQQELWWHAKRIESGDHLSTLNNLTVGEG